MIKKALLLLVLAAGMTACFSSSPDKSYFQLRFAPPEGIPPLNKVLLVDRVEIDDLYDDYRIIYRVSSFEVNYYSYEFWADKPSKLIRDAVIQALEDSGAFSRVNQDATQGDPDWILRLNVHQIEEVDEPGAWFARLNMRFEMVEAKSGKILAFRRVDRKSPLSKMKVDDLPAVLSRILAEELTALLKDLGGK
jgi:ABC-type uncharacterized transport system auxiliary subunit